MRLDAERFSSVARSSIGRILSSERVENLAASAIPYLFRLARIGAAAVKTLGEGEEAFLKELELTDGSSGISRRRLRKGLSRFERSFQQYCAAERLWERAFFEPSGAEIPEGELEAIDRERRLRSERVRYPRRALGFLSHESSIPPVRDRVFPPDDVFSHWAEEIWDPRALYVAPSEDTRFLSSRSFRRGRHREYFLRFVSPSRFLDDTVHARVFEPPRPTPEVLTLIYSGGLAMAYDQVRIWPEEEYVGARLAERGVRVVLVESPWHGRRAPVGIVSGELPLATSPVGLMLLLSTQTQEVGALVDWAHALPSPTVAVGGISLGAIVCQHVASRSREWPESFRPDAVFLNGAGLRLDQAGLHSRLFRVLGVEEKMRRAGWTGPLAALLRPVLDPPAPPSLPPERFVVLLARRDDFLPYPGGVDLVRSWGIPEKNVLTWDVGHLGIPVRLAGSDEVQEKWMSVLREASRAARPSMRLRGASLDPADDVIRSVRRGIGR